jgi:hypothetical protein
VPFFMVTTMPPLRHDTHHLGATPPRGKGLLCRGGAVPHQQRRSVGVGRLRGWWGQGRSQEPKRGRWWRGWRGRDATVATQNDTGHGISSRKLGTLQGTVGHGVGCTELGALQGAVGGPAREALGPRQSHTPHKPQGPQDLQGEHAGKGQHLSAWGRCGGPREPG